MSTKSTASLSSVKDQLLGWELKDVHALRLAIGTSLAMAIAFGLSWPMSFLLPVLVWNFLRTPSAGLTLASGLDVIFSLFCGCLFGAAFSLSLLRYPLIFVGVLWILLFLLFYANTGGISPNLFLWMMVGIIVVPLLGLQSFGLSLAIVGYLIAGGVAAVALTWMAQVLVPDALAFPQPGTPGFMPPQERPRMPESMRVRTAWLSTLAVGPLVTVVYTFNMADKILMMVFVALMAQAASAAAGAKAGAAMIIGNVIGGIAAVVFYYLLLAAPTYGFLICLTFLAGLMFAKANFSPKKMAPFYGMAFSNLLLLIGQSTAPGSDSAGLTFFIRVGQITLAAIYLILAFRLMEWFQKRGGPSDPDKGKTSTKEGSG